MLGLALFFFSSSFCLFRMLEPRKSCIIVIPQPYRPSNRAYTHTHAYTCSSDVRLDCRKITPPKEEHCCCKRSRAAREALPVLDEYVYPTRIRMYGVVYSCFSLSLSLSLSLDVFNSVNKYILLLTSNEKPHLSSGIHPFEHFVRSRIIIRQLEALSAKHLGRVPEPRQETRELVRNMGLRTRRATAVTTNKQNKNRKKKRKFSAKHFFFFFFFFFFFLLFLVFFLRPQTQHSKSIEPYLSMPCKSQHDH